MSFGFGAGLTPWVQRLIIANIAVWLLQVVWPPLTLWLQFVPGAVLYRPWTLITYMFAHDPNGIGHLLFNMIGLFFFGPPLEARWGSREFMKYYLLCGLGGAALSFLFVHSAIIGASAAIYGVMLGFAMNWPDAPIYIWGIFPVPAKYLVGVFFLISLYSGFAGRADGVAHLAHVGGVVAGFIYLKLDHRGGGLFTRARQMVKRHRLNVVSGAAPPDSPGAVGHMRQPGTPAAAPRRSAAGEAQLLNELDQVLDKISTQGMASLTPAERRLLDEASRRYRQN
jgi:membrane associated rhomboid family serine protease